MPRRWLKKLQGQNRLNYSKLTAILDLIQGGRVKLIELGLLHQQLVRHVSADLQPYIQGRLLLQ